MSEPIKVGDRVFVNAIGFGEVVELVATIKMLGGAYETRPVSYLHRDGNGYNTMARQLEEDERRSQNAKDGLDDDGFPLPEQP